MFYCCNGFDMVINADLINNLDIKESLANSYDVLTILNYIN